MTLTLEFPALQIWLYESHMRCKLLDMVAEDAEAMVRAESFHVSPVDAIADGDVEGVH